jgi:hypothetical protein
MSGLANRVDYAGAALFGLPEESRALFGRVPFGFQHNLSDLDLFDFESLWVLARS